MKITIDIDDFEVELLRKYPPLSFSGTAQGAVINNLYRRVFAQLPKPVVVGSDVILDHDNRHVYRVIGIHDDKCNTKYAWLIGNTVKNHLSVEEINAKM